MTEVRTALCKADPVEEEHLCNTFNFLARHYGVY